MCLVRRVRRAMLGGVYTCEFTPIQYYCYNPHRYDLNYETSITAKIEPHG